VRQIKLVFAVFIPVVLGIFVWCPMADADAVITEPPAGTLIQNRLDFPVAGSISDYNESRAANFHYWVSIASVKGNNKPDFHWPKFYVKSGHFQGSIHDGGQNPLPTPQPMIILLLRVDDATNQRFIRWFNRGVFEGFPVQNSEIVVSVPIRFR